VPGLRARFAVTASVLVLALVGVVGVQAPAWATDYPSWADVAKARSSEAATKAKIKQIEALIAGLQADVERTEAESKRLGDIYFEADQKFQQAALKADELQKQADEAEALAEQSIARAGEMVAQLYRGGNGDVATNLFVNASHADDLLYGLGMADKITEQTANIYEKALRDKQSAQALTDQANVAKDVREQLRAEAEVALKASLAAQAKAQAALNAQEAYQNQLQAQLAVLTQRRQATEADYLAGVRARAAANAQLGAGEISASGWAKPARGRITSQFGARADPYGGGGYSYHLGTDIGAGCGAPIFAAHTGTVVYAGWNGVYGNYIEIANGNGINTAYGHIKSGGIKVSYGQHVDVGQQIAKVGATGGATGCHLHFGVLINGVVTNPVPFMRNQGITLG
jgi:murein DD-endopeptidase MepM/ murein hydrolase activator NlpD